MEELLSELNKSDYDFTRDFILKTCLSLLGKGARYEVIKFKDPETLEDIIEKWKPISDAIKEVKDFLYEKTFLRTDSAVSSYLSLIPIIYFRYHFPDRWNSIQYLDDYVLRTLITGAFSGAPDSLIDIAVLNHSRAKVYWFNLGNWKYFFCRMPLTNRFLICSKQVVHIA